MLRTERLEKSSLKKNKRKIDKYEAREKGYAPIKRRPSATPSKSSVEEEDVDVEKYSPEAKPKKGGTEDYQRFKEEHKKEKEIMKINFLPKIRTKICLNVHLSVHRPEAKIIRQKIRRPKQKLAKVRKIKWKRLRKVNQFRNLKMNRK